MSRAARAIRRNFILALKIDTPAEKVKLALKIVNDTLADPEIRGPIRPVIGGKIALPQVYFSDYTVNSLEPEHYILVCPAQRQRTDGSRRKNQHADSRRF